MKSLDKLHTTVGWARGLTHLPELPNGRQRYHQQDITLVISLCLLLTNLGLSGFFGGLS